MGYPIVLSLLANLSFGQSIIFKKIVPIQQKKDTIIIKAELPRAIVSETKNVAIRCVGSIEKAVQPLYIVDGKIIDRSGYIDLKPETIESVKISKITANKFKHGIDKVIIIKTKKTPKESSGK